MESITMLNPCFTPAERQSLAIAYDIVAALTKNITESYPKADAIVSWETGEAITISDLKEVLGVIDGLKANDNWALI